MSILSQAINAYKSGTPLSQVVSQFISQAEGWAANLINKAQSDPAVATAINTAVTDIKTTATVAISWADTALSAELSTFGDEIAGVVTKYATKLAGSGSAPAIATIVGALVDVGVATVHHEALAAQTALQAIPTASTPAAQPVAADPQPQAGA